MSSEKKGRLPVKMEIDVSTIDFEALRKNVLKLAHRKAAEVAVLGVLSPKVKNRFDGSMEKQLLWAQRDPRYQEKKQRFKKRSAYMNYSGRTRGICLRQAQSAVRVMPKKAGLRFSELPLYVKRPRRGARIILRRELKVVAPQERRELAGEYTREFARFLNDDPRARVKRRRKI